MPAPCSKLTPLALLLALCWLTLEQAGAAPQLTCAQKLNSCSCRLTDGQIIDLEPLRGNPGPAFNHDAPDGYTYQYNPCGAYGCGPGESESAVCQEQLVIITKFVDFGIQSSAQFENDPSTGGLQLRYLSRDLSKSAIINLVCDPGATDATFSSAGAPGGAQLVADLRSRYACPVVPGTGGGMSAGDILLIVVFVLIVAYMLGGVLYNRFMQKKTGLEMLPNRALWSSLPGLVADGSAFVYDKCRNLVCRIRGGGTYTDIK